MRRAGTKGKNVALVRQASATIWSVLRQSGIVTTPRRPPRRACTLASRPCHRRVCPAKWMARARAREGVCWVSKVRKRDHLRLAREKNISTTEGGDEGGASVRTTAEPRGGASLTLLLPFASVPLWYLRPALLAQGLVRCHRENERQVHGVHLRECSSSPGSRYRLECERRARTWIAVCTGVCAYKRD